MGITKIDKDRPFQLPYIAIIIGVTVYLITVRLLFSNPVIVDLLNIQEVVEGRDVDFRILHDYMSNGLFKYYDQNSIGDVRPLYLYYWYFIFLPFYIMPVELSVYIWDALRFLSTMYVAINLFKITKNYIEVLLFFCFNIISYFIDGYLNNTNWLIQLLLFESYLQLDKDKKWLSGFLFTLAMYKVIVILFPLALLLSKKIKIKDLVYYLLPFFIIFLPYLIFPEYLQSMLYNWTYHGVNAGNNVPIIFMLFQLGWQAFQTAQLMFICLILLIFLVNIEDPKWRLRYAILFIIIIIIMTISFWLWSFYYAFILDMI